MTREPGHDTTKTHARRSKGDLAARSRAKFSAVDDILALPEGDRTGASALQTNVLKQMVIEVIEWREFRPCIAI